MTTSLPTPLQHYITNILPTLDGWCSPEKAESLIQHVLKHRPDSCVEIGVFAGRSLYAIALALKHNASGHAIGIDPWDSTASIAGFEQDPPNHEWWRNCPHETIRTRFLDHLKQLGLEDYVTTFHGTSRQFVSIRKALSQKQPIPPIDLLHIDGNHSEDQALYDVENYVPSVTPGGCIYFDDCDWLTTKRAQQRLLDFADPIGTVSNCGIYRRK